MLRLAHIVHPVIVQKTSDLLVAQPITFETMRLAKSFAEQQAKETLSVELYAIQYFDEARIPLPGCFARVPDLKRNVKDVARFQYNRKLAILSDILDALYKASGEADYLIYTNVDIALQPFFYTTLFSLISQGYDAFVINRRSITDRYTSIEQIPLMYAEIGSPHKGYDCFVFKRDVYPSYKLKSVCLGTPWVDRALLANMVASAKHFKEFKDEHLTFHIGNSRLWLREEYTEFVEYNKKAYMEIFTEIVRDRGEFDPEWTSYLVDQGDGVRKYPPFPEL